MQKASVGLNKIINMKTFYNCSQDYYYGKNIKCCECPKTKVLGVSPCYFILTEAPK